MIVPVSRKHKTYSTISWYISSRFGMKELGPLLQVTTRDGSADPCEGYCWGYPTIVIAVRTGNRDHIHRSCTLQRTPTTPPPDAGI